MDMVAVLPSSRPGFRSWVSAHLLRSGTCFCRINAHVLHHSSSLVDGLAAEGDSVALMALTWFCSHKILGWCRELTRVETWWYGDDSPHLADCCGLVVRIPGSIPSCQWTGQVGENGQSSVRGSNSSLWIRPSVAAPVRVGCTGKQFTCDRYRLGHQPVISVRRFSRTWEGSMYSQANVSG